MARYVGLLLVAVLLVVVSTTATCAAFTINTTIIGSVLYGPNLLFNTGGPCSLAMCRLVDAGATCSTTGPGCICSDACATGPLCTNRRQGSVFWDQPNPDDFDYFAECASITTLDVSWVASHGIPPTLSIPPAPCSNFGSRGCLGVRNASFPVCVRQRGQETVVLNNVAIPLPFVEDICCPRGRIGDSCNQCTDSSVCLHGGQCDLAGTRICTGCLAGWGGNFCDVQCPRGFTGYTCSQFAGCKQEGCKNGGVCTTSTGICACGAFYNGTYCDTHITAGVLRPVNATLVVGSALYGPVCGVSVNCDVRVCELNSDCRRLDPFATCNTTTGQCACSNSTAFGVGGLCTRQFAPSGTCAVLGGSCPSTFPTCQRGVGTDVCCKRGYDGPVCAHFAGCTVYGCGPGTDNNVCEPSNGLCRPRGPIDSMRVIGNALYGPICNFSTPCIANQTTMCTTDAECRRVDAGALCSTGGVCKCSDPCMAGGLCTTRTQKPSLSPNSVVLNCWSFTEAERQAFNAGRTTSLVAPREAPCAVHGPTGCAANTSFPVCYRPTTLVAGLPSVFDVCCKRGYTGATCSEFVGCTAGGCTNGGPCNTADGTCYSCAANYTGTLCDQRCTSPSQLGCVQPSTLLPFRTLGGMTYGPNACGITRDCWKLGTVSYPVNFACPSYAPAPFITDTNPRFINANGTLVVLAASRGQIGCCPWGWTGEHCEKHTGCSAYSLCTHGVCGYANKCVCNAGWKGQQCNEPCMAPECDFPVCSSQPRTIGNRTFAPGICWITASCTVSTSTGLINSNGCPAPPPFFMCADGRRSTGIRYTTFVQTAPNTTVFVSAGTHVCCPVGWTGDNCEIDVGCSAGGTPCRNGAVCLTTDKHGSPIPPADTRCFGCAPGVNGTRGWHGRFCEILDTPTFIEVTSVITSLGRRLLGDANTTEFVRADPISRTTDVNGFIYKEPARCCDCGVSWNATKADSIFTFPILWTGNYSSPTQANVLLSPVRYSVAPAAGMVNATFFRPTNNEAEAQYQRYRYWADGGYYYNSVTGESAFWVTTPVAGTGNFLAEITKSNNPATRNTANWRRKSITRLIDPLKCPNATLNATWYYATYMLQCEAIRMTGGLGNWRVDAATPTTTLAFLHFNFFGHRVRNRPNPTCDLTVQYLEDEIGCVNTFRVPKTYAVLPQNASLPCGNSSMIDPSRVAFGPLLPDVTGFNVSDAGVQHCSCLPPFRATDTSVRQNCAFDLCGSDATRGYVNATYANSLDHLGHFNHSDPAACMCIGKLATDPASCSGDRTKCDWCATTTCQNGGSLVGSDYNAPCACPTVFFIGDHCEQNICVANQSIPFNITLWQTKFPGVPPAEWACSCLSGFVGIFCEHQACEHGIYNYQARQCVCDDGWDGDTCEHIICKPGQGRWENGACACFAPWRGATCEEHSCDDSNDAQRVANWAGVRPFGVPVVNPNFGLWECGCTFPYTPRNTSNMDCQTYRCNHGVPNPVAARVLAPKDACVCEESSIGIFTDARYCTDYTFDHCPMMCLSAMCSMTPSDVDKSGGVYPTVSSATDARGGPCCSCPVALGFHMSNPDGCQPFCSFAKPCLSTNTSGFHLVDKNDRFARWLDSNVSLVAGNDEWVCECASDYSSADPEAHDCSLYTPLVRDAPTVIDDGAFGDTSVLHGDDVPVEPAIEASGGGGGTTVSTGVIVGVSVAGGVVLLAAIAQQLAQMGGSAAAPKPAPLAGKAKRSAYRRGSARMISLMCLVMCALGVRGDAFLDPMVAMDKAHWDVPAEQNCSVGAAAGERQITISFAAPVDGSCPDMWPPKAGCWALPPTNTRIRAGVYPIRDSTFFNGKVPFGIGPQGEMWDFSTWNLIDIKSYTDSGGPTTHHAGISHVYMLSGSTPTWRTANTTLISESTKKLLGSATFGYETIYPIAEMARPLPPGYANAGILNVGSVADYAPTVTIGGAVFPHESPIDSSIGIGVSFSIMVAGSISSGGSVSWIWNGATSFKAVAFALGTCNADSDCGTGGSCIVRRGVGAPASTGANIPSCEEERITSSDYPEYAVPVMDDQQEITYHPKFYNGVRFAGIMNFRSYTVRGCRCKDGMYGPNCKSTCPAAVNSPFNGRSSLCSYQGNCTGVPVTATAPDTYTCRCSTGCRCDPMWTGARCETLKQTKLLSKTTFDLQLDSNTTLTNAAVGSHGAQILTDWSRCCPAGSTDCSTQSIPYGIDTIYTPTWTPSTTTTVTPVQPCPNPIPAGELGVACPVQAPAGTPPALIAALAMYAPQTYRCGEKQPRDDNGGVGSDGRGQCWPDAYPFEGTYFNGTGLAFGSRAACFCNPPVSVYLPAGSADPALKQRRGWWGDYCEKRTCTSATYKMPNWFGAAKSTTIAATGGLVCSGHSHSTYSGTSLNYDDNTMPCEDRAVVNLDATVVGRITGINTPGVCKMCADGWGASAGYSHQKLTVAGYPRKFMGVCSEATLHSAEGAECGGYGNVTSTVVAVQNPVTLSQLTDVKQIKACTCPSEWGLRQDSSGICQRSCVSNTARVAIPFQYIDAATGRYTSTVNLTFSNNFTASFCGGYGQGLCRPIDIPGDAKYAGGWNSACMCNAGFDGPDCHNITKMWYRGSVCGPRGEAVQVQPPRGAGAALSNFTDEDYFWRYIVPLTGTATMRDNQTYSQFRCQCRADAAAVGWLTNRDGICTRGCGAPELMGGPGNATSCSGHGTCVDDPHPGVLGKLCRCDIGWGGENCATPYRRDSTGAMCGGADRGLLTYADTYNLTQECRCDTGYTFNPALTAGDPRYHLCWRNCPLGATNALPCSGAYQGTCGQDPSTQNDNICTCLDNAFTGADCSIKTVAVYTTQSGNQLACTGHGVPSKIGTCICDAGYVGDACEQYITNRPCGFGQSYLDAESVDIVVS